MCFCMYRTVLTVFLFGVRGFATGFFQAIYLYTPEVSEVFNMETCDNYPSLLGVSNCCESFWDVVVLKCQPSWCNDCSLYCPGQYISFGVYISHRPAVKHITCFTLGDNHVRILL